MANTRHPQCALGFLRWGHQMRICIGWTCGAAVHTSWCATNVSRNVRSIRWAGADSTDRALVEVIMTAEKMKEPLNKAPASITVRLHLPWTGKRWSTSKIVVNVYRSIVRLQRCSRYRSLLVESAQKEAPSPQRAHTSALDITYFARSTIAVQRRECLAQFDQQRG